MHTNRGFSDPYGMVGLLIVDIDIVRHDVSKTRPCAQGVRLNLGQNTVTVLAVVLELYLNVLWAR